MKDKDQLTTVLKLKNNELKQKISDLESLLQKNNTLIDNFPDMFILLDTNAKILLLNEAMARNLGEKKENLIGKNALDYFPPEVAKNRTKMAYKLIKTKKPFTFEDKRDGRWFKQSLFPVLDSEGNVIQIANMVEEITKQKKIELYLEKKEGKLQNVRNKYDLIVEEIADVLMQVSLTGKILYINPTCERIAGFKPEEVIGKRFTKFAPIREIPRYFSKIQDMKSGKKITNFETKIIHKNGNIIPVEFSGQMVVQDKKKYIHAVMRDISKRKKTEIKLKESEEKFRMLSDQSLMGIGIIQSDKIKYVNEAIKLITGYSKKEIISEGTKMLTKIIHPDDQTFVLNQLKKKLSGDQNVIDRYPFRIITKNGKQKWIELFSKTINFEGENADLVTFVDITEQKIYEESLKQSEEKYRSVFESASEAITITDSSGKILDINSSAIDILGYDSKEMIGKNAAPGYLYPEQRKEMFKKLMKNGYVRNHELTFKHKDGSHINVLGSATILRNKNNQVDRIVGIFTNITDRVKVEKEIKITKDYLQNVIDSASEIIFTIGSDFKIKTWNKSARTITGYKQSHVVGKSINNLTLFENQSEINDYIKTILNGKTASLEEITINTSFGIKKQFSVSPSFIRDESKNVNEVLFVCRDITYEKERHGKLQFGQSYLISESTSEAAVEIFAGMLRSGHPGLYIGRTSDSEIKNIFTDVTPTIVKLSKEKDKKHLTCSNFEELLRTIKDYVSKEKQSIVLLDRIEYLIINSSFESVIKNIYLLNDMIGKHNCLLLLRISPSLLDKTQMVILKEELRQLPERQIDDVQLEETLFEILDYVQIENKRNAILSYSRIGKQFSISKVTTQRRIESLLEKGLVFTKKQGRIKTIYITDKGKNLLAQRSII